MRLGVSECEWVRTKLNCLLTWADSGGSASASRAAVRHSGGSRCCWCRRCAAGSPPSPWSSPSCGRRAGGSACAPALPQLWRDHGHTGTVMVIADGRGAAGWSKHVWVFVAAAAVVTADIAVVVVAAAAVVCRCVCVCGQGHCAFFKQVCALFAGLFMWFSLTDRKQLCCFDLQFNFDSSDFR